MHAANFCLEMCHIENNVCNAQFRIHTLVCLLGTAVNEEMSTIMPRATVIGNLYTCITPYNDLAVLVSYLFVSVTLFFVCSQVTRTPMTICFA